MSDSEGNATWQTEGFDKSSFFADYNTASTSHISTRWNVWYSGTYIDLPPGQWLVILSLGIHADYTLDYTAATPTYTDIPENRAIWVRSFFSDSSTGYYVNPEVSTDGGQIYSGISPDIYLSPLMSGSLVGPSSNSTLNAEVFINQKSASTKRYYLMYQFESYGIPIDNTPGSGLPYSGTARARVKDFGRSPNSIPENKIIAYPITF